MCYLCMLYDPFAVSNDFSSPRFKRARMIEIKRMMHEIESDGHLCHIGDSAYEALREEQYRLSRDL